ncbi:MAG: phosphoribosylformylglycinamidine synthase [Treponema sp.]|nr:phosphoribosylformylglycinamidine synthase [Treponema sp.]
MNVFEVYAEKKPQFAGEAQLIESDIKQLLKIDNITAVRVINRYFTEGISSDDFEYAKNNIFSEPPVDFLYDTLPSFEKPGESLRFFTMEFLPGQYDQRADFCAQCISLSNGKKAPVVRTAKIIAVYGNISDDDFSRIKTWLINPVESRETSLEKPSTLIQNYPQPPDIETLNGFISLKENELQNFRITMNLAMDLSDLKFCQNYFRDDEKRDPTVTEIRVLDTYWSDHCRHTTFLTELKDIQIEDEFIKESYDNYLELRTKLGRQDKPVTLMDMATIGTKALKKQGKLKTLDESEEINACSVKIKVDVNGKNKNWLLMFKNETHNHPTEIEPFGGASTCLGGAIRDPLSGRSFVYQAMRITGAADPLQNISSTLEGKLPQIKICRTAASGYSSYGNQIGAATGLVHEIYHQGYAAKRMELGAVIGAAPVENVKRKTPAAGDVVILLGGKTGRDGIGGATSSSKSHTVDSFETCGAEVQKGNPAEERKILRLFRNPVATRLIKRCNDFGAGGVSVSVGELADGLKIDLNKVPSKYNGLDGTELAISESQERMSIVTAKKDADKFLTLAAKENIEATIIAEVTNEKRLIMNWNGKTIVNLSRKFLNSNGAIKYAKAQIKRQLSVNLSFKKVNEIDNAEDFEKFSRSLNICSQKGLINNFDYTVGAATVVSPLGGKYQLTPAQIMAAKIPVLNGDTNTCSLMSWGFDPDISSESTYHGAFFAVMYSAAKIIAAGGSRKNCWLSFQEYFEKLGNNPKSWGKPAAALLGALDAQMELEIAAIGGKDSMSGSFEKIDVPPTLVSFAVSTAKTENIITPEFKKADSFVYFIKLNMAAGTFNFIEKLISGKKVLSAWAVGNGGTAEAILKMCAGNRIGFASKRNLSTGGGLGGFIIEMDKQITSYKDIELFGGKEKSFSIVLLGRTTKEYSLKTLSFEISMEKIQAAWEKTLEPVYPYLIENSITNLHEPTRTFDKLSSKNLRVPPCPPCLKNMKPRFLIPIFPDTNSEYDTIKAIEKAGGKAKTFIVRNLTPSDITQSLKDFKKALNETQILILAAGSSGLDEPSGSGRFISSFFKNPVIADAVIDLITKRDGLICGIGNAYQALLKLGLLPYGEIRDMTEHSPTLLFNTIGRHQCTFINTKIVSNKSPWLSHLETESQYIVPVSHGEGRFTASESVICELAANGQIASQYVDFEGNASQDIRFNPNNSSYAIESITSPDGRIFGTMAHNERIDSGLYKNIPSVKKMDIFTGAVRYFG